MDLFQDNKSDSPRLHFGDGAALLASARTAAALKMRSEKLIRTPEDIRALMGESRFPKLTPQDLRRAMQSQAPPALPKMSLADFRRFVTMHHKEGGK